MSQKYRDKFGIFGALDAADMEKDVKTNENVHLVRSEVIYRDEEFNLRRADGFSAEVIEFLDTTTWGTEDTLYEHKKTDERIRDLTDPIPILASIEDRLLALVVLDRRPVSNAGFSCVSYFFRYLASNATFRERATVGKAGQKTMDIVREGEQEKAIYFATIEGRNRRSYNFVKGVGYEQIAEMRSFGFSRFFPRSSKNVEQVKTEAARAEVLQLLREKYQHHSLLHFSNLFKHDHAYVLKRDGKVKAFVQVHEALWVIKKMKGKKGELIMKYAPHIPLINQLFNPNRFQFIAFEGLYYHEDINDLIRLMEAALAIHKVKSALFWFDAKDPMHHEFNECGKLGLLHKFVQENNAFVLASFRNLTDEDEKRIRTAPVYISGFDNI